jgi:hypothetical protein
VNNKSILKAEVDPPPYEGKGFDLARILLSQLLLQYEDSDDITAKFIRKILAELLILREEVIFKTNGEFLVLHQIIRSFLQKPPEDLPLTISNDLETVALLCEDMANDRYVNRGEIDFEMVWPTSLSHKVAYLSQKIKCPACEESFYPVRAVEESDGLFRCPKCNQLTH